MKQKLSLGQSYLLLALFPAYFMIVGLFMQPPSEILSGLRSIIREPDFLITDYFVIGGIGAAFLNAGLITLVLLFVLYLLRMEIDGHTLTSCCLIFGFSLFGKNVVNIWSILLGVYLYAHYHRTSIRSYLYVGFPRLSHKLCSWNPYPLPCEFHLVSSSASPLDLSCLHYPPMYILLIRAIPCTM